MIAVLVLAALSSAALGVYGLNLVYLSLRALRLRPAPVRPLPAGGEPAVCVQVPIYDERYVARRVIDAACSLDWPRDRLQVQVLDDSDDATVGEVAAAVAHWRGLGVDVVHVRRAARLGYKAGALAHGLAATTAPFIAVFDADFVPPPDFLRRLMGGFDAPDVAWVQGRWGHLNETYSLFTRLQALMIDFHFLVEQAVRAGHGYPTNFTGTAGVWRREAILAAGGWSARTVAEDLDLSYRVQLAGWRGVFVEDAVAPQELPVAAAAYRGQQLRWATGTFQCAALLLPALLRSDLRPAARFQGAIRLLAYCAPLLMLLQVCLFPLLLPVVGAAGVRGAVVPLALAANLLSLAPVFGLAAAQARRGRGWWRPLPAVLAWSLVGAGTSLAVAVALVRALRPQAFNRTPKYRIERRGQEWRDRDYVVALDPFAPAELGLAVVLAALTGLWLEQGQWLVAAYSALFSAGFGLLGGLSLLQGLQVLTLRRLGRHALELTQRAGRTALLLAPPAALLAVVAGLGVAFEDSYAHWLVAATMASGGGLHDPLFGMEDTWLPAYHVLAAGVLLVFGLHSLWALRALSIGLGLLTLALTARLAPDARRGRAAVALLALNPAFLLTFTSAVAEPLMTPLLLGAAIALQSRRLRAAALLAALACLVGTKAWLWLGVAVAIQVLALLPGRRPQLGWALPALAVLALLQLGFSPAEHSVARASVEVASATQRGSLPAGAAGRAAAFAGWFALATLPVLLLAPLGLLREVRARSWSLLSVHAPSLGYLGVATALVAAGLYSGSDRYYVLALPSLALLAAEGLAALPAPATVAATACAALVAVAYAPVLADFAAENSGLLAAGRAAGSVPGRLLTDSPAAAYASGKPPGELEGSRALPLQPDPAVAWLEDHGFGALVLEDVDYYRAATVFPGLTAGRSQPPFAPLGPPGAFDVAGGKPVSAWMLPRARYRAPVAGVAWLTAAPADEPRAGRTAELEKGPVLQAASGSQSASGEGLGFGVPIAQFADGWVLPGDAVTVDLSPPGGFAWRRTYALDRLLLVGADGRFEGYREVAARGHVQVDYRVNGDRLDVGVRVLDLGAASDVAILNEASSAFDDEADGAGTRLGQDIGYALPVAGGWARLRSATLGLEWALDRPPGASLVAGRELEPGQGVDWAGLELHFGSGFRSTDYEITFRRAR